MVVQERLHGLRPTDELEQDVGRRVVALGEREPEQVLDREREAGDTHPPRDHARARAHVARLDGDHIAQPEAPLVDAVEDEGRERDLDEARQLARTVGVERERPTGPEVPGLDGERAVGGSGQRRERRRPVLPMPPQPMSDRRRSEASAVYQAHTFDGVVSRSRCRAFTTTERCDEWDPLTST